MQLDTALSLRHERSFFYRAYAASLDLRRALVEFRRTQQERGCLLRMTEYQLRDIGFRRERVGGVLHVLPLADDGERSCR
jgi:uncharacterized protein YjiS (DUF1127 family)